MIRSLGQRAVRAAAALQQGWSLIIRTRTLAACTAMAMLLSGCILFPPFWFPTDPMAPGAEIAVANETDADWVISYAGDFPTAFAIGAGQVGTVTTFGSEPTELVLLDPECVEADRLDWDGTAAGVLISDPGTLAATDEAPDGETTTFAEYWDCIDGAFGAAPEPGTPLPEAGGTILLVSGDGATFVLDVASATLTPLGEQTGNGMDGEHAWSRDGTRLAFSRLADSDFSSAVYVADADGGDAELLIENAAGPRWSPDGTQIAYLSTDPFAGASTLAVIGLDGREPRELADNASTAAWSPDGERLAFMTAPDLDSFEVPAGELRIVNADGSGLRTVSEAAPFAAPPAWSPDGERLAFVSLPDGADPNAFDIEALITVHDLENDVTSVLAQVEGAGLGEPTWSPDGETVAFTMMTASLFESTGALATVAATGGPVTRVSEGQSAYYSTPIWSPDSQWLAVARSADTDLNSSLVAVRPDGTDETVLATGLISATAWRPDPS